MSDLRFAVGRPGPLAGLSRAFHPLRTFKTDPQTGLFPAFTHTGLATAFPRRTGGENKIALPAVPTSEVVTFRGEL